MVPFVSVITVNHNGKRFLADALAALHAQDYPRDRYEIIVVDNASSDGSLEAARAAFPGARFVASAANVGFAEGNNIGYRESKGELIALLNNDAVASPGWLAALVAAMERHPEAGLATSKILFMQRALSLELHCETFLPQQVMASTDTRPLGIKVLGVDLDGLAGAHCAFREGFYPEESGNGQRFRWTDGRGRFDVVFHGAGKRLPMWLKLDGWRPEALPEAELVVKSSGSARARVVLPRGPMRLPLVFEEGEMARVPRRIQNVGVNAYRDWFAGDRASGEPDDGRYAAEEEVFGACGAAMMVRRKVVEECGLFDPSFFMYYEDVDLAFRARARGHRCVYVPSAVVEHYHAGSSKEGSAFFTYNVERNRLAVILKHAPPIIVARALVRYTSEALRLARREIRRGVFRGGEGSAGGAARLKLRVLASLAAKSPRLLARRAAVGFTATVPKAEILKWLGPRKGSGSRVRIGVYDLHLRTLGGGEKYLADVAAALSESYEVDLIAYRPVGKIAIAERLDVDLENVRIVSLPGDRELDLRSMSSPYDLFINGTHDSELEAYSRRSILVCHFPKRRQRKPLGEIVRSFFTGSGVEYESGFYQPEVMGGVSQRWTNGSGTLRIRNAVGKRGLVVDLRIIEYRLEGVDVRFAVEGRQVPFDEVNILDGGVTQYKVRVRPEDIEPGRQYFHLTIVSSTWRPTDGGGHDDRRLGVIVQDVSLWQPGGLPASFAKWKMGYLAGGLSDDVSRRFPHLHTYDEILTHSQYSAGWIDRYWGRSARLIYPAIEGLAPLSKRNVILSVGRFFEGHHNKKHLLMVLAFKALVDEGLAGWEFHLVGGTHEEEHHRRYLARVEQEAKGYPIHVHANIPYEELKRHYGEASIFWHASGYEEDERHHPERFEHFGISTVEAMLAGAVPVVIGKAGQLETVRDGVDGFLWSDVGTLKARTRQLAGDPELRRQMGARAMEKARGFSQAAFRDKVLELARELLE
ncbi:MAG: glycosyltransferase [Acidobacteriota bacterium]